MAVRIRADGRIFCAALHPEQAGDIYLHDGIHYALSVELKLLVTEESDQHMLRGEWWWKGLVPDGIEIEPFYDEPAVNQANP